jgi:uncharacterized protein YdhG (YjbR/CyaY superfamily)
MVASKKKPSAKAPRKKPETVEDYLASVPPDARAALLKLRKTIQSAAPDATEEISYQVPTFKLNGGLVAYAAFPDHCSFFVMSTAVMRAHAAELQGYPVGKGSIRFSPDEPLPAALVRKLVKARIAENEARGRSRRR